ncbi:MAG TPA: hypothetical protein VN688_10130 [Gemmataceae bacterium]|nr:hypothetical protein [Gemmataceae bacterium]
MKRLSPVIALIVLTGVSPLSSAAEPRQESLAQLQKTFADYSGSRLVFAVKDLPEGAYHDLMPPLDEKSQLRAARIALVEIRKLPPRYLKKMGLKAVGIFAACISNQGDGFRPYDEQLKGYRYFGIYNGKNALAAAYYSDAQLPTTLHHEIFHHVDATLRGETKYTVNFVRDERFKVALSGEEPYRALGISNADLAALKKRGKGFVLEKSVSKYAEKSVGEDKAETARYLMTALPDALVQMATRPELAGSQRMLHVLHKYQQAIADGPGVDWFVSVALGTAAQKSPGAASRHTAPK